MLRATDIRLPTAFARHPSQELQLGVRSHRIHVSRQRDTDLAIDGKVDLAEISGSDTYLHVGHNEQSLVAQLPGVHNFVIGTTCTLYINPADLYGFNAQGSVLFAPADT
jgi:glycerol transport system ATP-binding protein